MVDVVVVPKRASKFLFSYFYHVVLMGLETAMVAVIEG